MKREILSMNPAWRFHKGDLPKHDFYGPYDHQQVYQATKTEASNGPARRDYDDSTWEIVHLPHDYVGEGVPSEETQHPSFACLARPNAWYRKTFKLSPEDRGKRISLIFDGVATACTVDVNSIPMKRNGTRGIGFEVDITDIAHYGENVNVVSVFVDNTKFEGWYYEGGGIYRDVWLVKSDKLHVDLWGTYVVSQPAENGAWNSHIETEITNLHYTDKKFQLQSDIMDADGTIVASAITDASAASYESLTIKQDVVVPDVKVWDIDSPNLYTLVSQILVDGDVVDDYITSIGFRTIQYTNNDGFYLNGRKLFVMGYGCHQDFSSFGTAVPAAANDYRIGLLKKMGFNTYRCAHNPHAPHLYDACDKLGMMCMDENRWFIPNDDTKDEIRRMIKRDRNHPSVIMWSIFNEEQCRNREIGRTIFQTLRATALKYDQSRPVTGADDTGYDVPRECEGMDILGINHCYDGARLDRSRKLFPDTPVFYSEVGVGHDGVKKLLTDRPYMFGALGFGGLPRSRGMRKHPFGISRNGKVTIPKNFIQPFSPVGLPQDRFYWHKAYWTEVPVVHIGGDWNHEAGEIVPVTIYTNYAQVELKLNGKSLGVRDVDSFDREIEWEVPFEAGELVAVAYAEGKEPITDVLKTVGKATHLSWQLENASVCNNGMDVALITIFAQDDNGNNVLIGDAEYPLSFEITSGGQFVSANTCDMQDYSHCHEPKIVMKGGHAQLYVLCDTTSNPVELKVHSDDFATLDIHVEKVSAPQIPAVPGEDTRYLPMWYISPTRKDMPYPDIEEMRKDLDLSGWLYTEVSRGSNGEFMGMFGNHGMPAMREDTPKESLRNVYYTTSKVALYDGTFKQVKLVFERFDAYGRVIIRGVGNAEGKVAQAYKRPDDPSYFEMNAEGFLPGDEVEVWVILEASDNYSAIRKPVRWAFE